MDSSGPWEETTKGCERSEHQALAQEQLTPDVLATPVRSTARGRNARMLADGSRPAPLDRGPKTLGPAHRQIIALHLAGRPAKAIARQTGYTDVRVGQVLRSKVAREVIEEGLAEAEAELKALLPRAIGVVRDALGAATHRDQLAAVDRWIKLEEHVGIRDAKSTAEDIASSIFAGASIAGPVQVNVHTAEPPRAERATVRSNPLGCSATEPGRVATAPTEIIDK